ncbi:uncharacterized protein LOC110855103 [Folsomia candida]|uniref:uncharacterized protein LOC110855103 n=1 Tax=Folsomia candida TaxID=158441 RepID=UPI0016053D31|nr:uncharacterized protein LOC110855103 [Folsomia candida]XP_035711568.1 uncharacterized protein LOC110855103 [Folsomia candida]
MQDNNANLAPLNQVEEYQMPLFPSLSKYNRRQARRCKKYNGEKKERLLQKFMTDNEELIQKTATDAVKTLIRRASSMQQKIDDPNFVENGPFDGLMIQAADNTVQDTGK